MDTNASQQASLSIAEAVSLLQQVASALRGAGKESDATKFEQLAGGLVENFSEEHRVARIEKYKADLAKWEAEVKYHLDWKLESFRGTLVLAQRAITAAMLVNGGAAVAILAYMGDTRATAAAFALPLALFAGGVFIAAITFALSYIAQFLYTDSADDDQIRGKGWHWAALIAALLSYSVFAGGVVTSYSAFKRGAQALSVSAHEEKNMPPPRRPGPPPSYPTRPNDTPQPPQTPKP